MGKPMSKNLVKAGYDLIVYDINPQAVEEVAAYGAIAGLSPADVAAISGIVITMLPNSPEVRTCVLGENGILEGAKQGLIIIDMSSIAPLESKNIAGICADKGVHMIDAPVSGGQPKAVDGTLSIMVGGDKTIFEKVYDILMVMGSTAVYCGDIGAGNTTKLVNQIIVAVNIAAISEGLTLAKKAGLAPEVVFDAIRGGLAGSTALNAKAPMMISDDFKPGFKINLHIKDLRNVLETGHSIGTPLPLTAMVMEMMQTLRADGFGECDHSALSKYYAKVSGTAIGDGNPKAGQNKL